MNKRSDPCRQVLVGRRGGCNVACRRLPVLKPPILSVIVQHFHIHHLDASSSETPAAWLEIHGNVNMCFTASIFEKISKMSPDRRKSKSTKLPNVCSGRGELQHKQNWYREMNVSKRRHRLRHSCPLPSLHSARPNLTKLTRFHFMVSGLWPGKARRTIFLIPLPKRISFCAYYPK